MGNKQVKDNFRDDFFTQGNWGLKIKQALVAMVGWIAIFIPILTIWIIFQHHELKLFGNHIGFTDLVIFGKFLLIILAFAFVIIGAFSVSMAIIQHERSRHYLNKWPNFDPIERQVVINKLDEYATTKYGDKQFRENVTNLVVPKDLNIEDGKLQSLINHDEEQ